MKPFIRHHKSGVSRIVRANYNTNQYGQDKKAEWWRISGEVRKRDNNRCIWCGKPASQVHHIKPLSRGGLTVKANLGCVCDECHDKRHPHMHEKAKRKFVEPF